jgi:hypothetical protein
MFRPWLGDASRREQDEPQEADPGDWAESSWLRAACAEALVLLMSLRPWRSIYPHGHASSVLPGLACQPALRW